MVSGRGGGLETQQLVPPARRVVGKEPVTVGPQGDPGEGASISSAVSLDYTGPPPAYSRVTLESLGKCRSLTVHPCSHKDELRDHGVHVSLNLKSQEAVAPGPQRPGQTCPPGSPQVKGRPAHPCPRAQSISCGVLVQKRRKAGLTPGAIFPPECTWVCQLKNRLIE